MTSTEPRERVEFVDEEFVGERGSVKVVWFVAHNDGFVPASRAPGATSERLDTGPRVVWRRRAVVELARGTVAVRIETRPNAARGSTLSHLTGTARTKRAGVVKTRFVVGARGRLVPEPARTPSRK